MRDLAIRCSTLAIRSALICQLLAHTAAGQSTTSKRFGVAGIGLVGQPARSDRADVVRGTGGFLGQAGLGYQLRGRLAAQVDLSFAGFPAAGLTYDVCPINGCSPVVTGSETRVALSGTAVLSPPDKESGGMLLVGAGMWKLLRDPEHSGQVAPFVDVGFGIFVPLGGRDAWMLDVRYQRTMLAGRVPQYFVPVTTGFRF